MDELLDTAPCGFLSFTDDGTIETVNTTLVDWLSYDADALVGRKIDLLLPIASRIFYQTHFFPLLKLQGRAEEIFLTLSSSDGSSVPVLINAVRRTRDERPVNDCVFLTVYQRRQYEDEILRAKQEADEALQNNEELVEAREQLQARTEELDQHVLRLQQRNKELARLSRILAHDLLEPLRKMSVFADILNKENQSELTRWGRQAVERINAGAVRMDELLHGLQQFLSLETAAERAVSVPLEEVAHAAQEKACRGLSDKDVEFQVSDLPTVEGHREQLVLMFSELFENSIKFRKPEGTASIRVRGQVVQYNRFRATEGRYRYVDYAEVFYSDNSIGFEERHSAQLFEVFAKLDSSSEGPGVGLAVVRKVVELHGGTISVEPRPGEGVTFRLALPVHQPS